MFEEKTFENLEQEKLDRIALKYDKREGSVIYDATAPNSAETAQVYIYMDWMLKQMFGDTADRDYLMRIAKDTRGVSPKKATHAILKGIFNVPVPIGSRFSLDSKIYGVTEAMDEGSNAYKLQCETIGNEGNKHFGTLVPIDYITGLTEAELTELLIAGEDEEDTEVFRQRWRDAFASLSFAGNKADYKEKINAIQGVGGCKISRAADEQGNTAGGHVKCVIISSEYTVPTDELVSSVQQVIDPRQDQEGDGLAPLWHVAHIIPVKGVPITISASITYNDGYYFEDVKSYIEEGIAAYILELNKTWEASEQLVVRITRIESAILEVKGVLDITGTTLNGKESNIILDVDEIAVRGEISG